MPKKEVWLWYGFVLSFCCPVILSTTSPNLFSKIRILPALALSPKLKLLAILTVTELKASFWINWCCYAMGEGKRWWTWQHKNDKGGTWEARREHRDWGTWKPTDRLSLTRASLSVQKGQRNSEEVGRLGSRIVSLARGRQDESVKGLEQMEFRQLSRLCGDLGRWTLGLHPCGLNLQTWKSQKVREALCWSTSKNKSKVRLE